MNNLKIKEIKGERDKIVKEISKIEKRKAELSSVYNIRNVRRPRLERDLGRGGMIRRQQQSSLFNTQKRNLLSRKKILDKQLEGKNDKSRSI